MSAPMTFYCMFGLCLGDAEKACPNPRCGCECHNGEVG